MRTTIILASVLALAALAPAASGQTRNFGDRTPSVIEIERALNRPPAPDEPGVKTRGLAIGAASKAVDQPAAPPSPPPSISMRSSANVTLAPDTGR